MFLINEIFIFQINCCGERATTQQKLKLISLNNTTTRRVRNSCGFLIFRVNGNEKNEKNDFMISWILFPVSYFLEFNFYENMFLWFSTNDLHESRKISVNTIWTVIHKTLNRTISTIPIFFREFFLTEGSIETT